MAYKVLNVLSCFFVFYCLSIIIFSVLIFLSLSFSLVIALGIHLREKLTLKLSIIAFSMDDLKAEDSHLLLGCDKYVSDCTLLCSLP